MAFTDLSYFIGQGTLFAAKRTINGAQTGGYVDMGDVDQFVIDPKQTFENISENRTGLGLTAAHVATETMLNVKLRLAQQSQANWEKAIWGTASGSVTGASVAAEAVTIYPGPSIVPLAHPGVSSVVPSLGTVDVDYTVDAANGCLNILAGSAVFTDTAGTAATVNYDFATYTGSIEAFTTFQPTFKLRLNGIDTANNGQPTIVECYQWQPDMAGSIELISKKHTLYELGGMLIQDQTKALATATNPFSQFLKVTRA